MPKRPKFIPRHTVDGWLLEVPATMAKSGKRERWFYQDEAEAEKAAKGLRGEYHRGYRSGVISRDLAAEAQKASDILAPTGLTLVEAAKAILAQHEASGGAETFRERYAKALLDGEGRWSAIYARDMTRIPRWIGDDLMDSRCALINEDTIASALNAHGAEAQSTLQHRARYVSAILNHKPKHRKAKEIEIMSHKQCGQFLRGAENKTEKRAGAVLLFAGVRPDAEDGEITRLDWDMFRPDEIYIPGEISKTGTDRHIPITPRLRRLIKGHPKSGPVVPANWRRVYRRMRKSAGLTTEQDITRHTFASHFLAAYGEKATKDAMGHTANSRTLFGHYRRAVLEIEGKAYFGDLDANERKVWQVKRLTILQSKEAA